MCVLNQDLGKDLHLCTASTKPELSLERQGGIWVTQPSWAVPTGICIPLVASGIRCPQVPLPELSLAGDTCDT